MSHRFVAALGLIACLCATQAIPRSAGADQPPLKIGLLATFSGFFAINSKITDAAVAAFIKEHGDTVAGRKLEIIKRDDGGLAPENAKRLAQDLILSDHVDYIMGLTFSPNAKAVGDVSTAAKKPTLITNAGADGILDGNPYMVRLSSVERQQVVPLADWASKSGLKNAYLVYLDFAPGYDAKGGFATEFTKNGGKVAGEVAVPVNTTDFSAYIQRIRDAKPQAVFCFLTSQGGAFLKAWSTSGGPASGIKILATADLTNEQVLPALGDTALGVYTSMIYSATLNTPLNRQLTRDMHAFDPTISSPDFYSVAQYDALQAIYKATEMQHGDVDPEKTMALLKGMKFDSPRGPIEIDPQTRDIVQNVYIGRVDKVNGVYQNTVIATYPHIKDPGPK